MQESVPGTEGGAVDRVSELSDNIEPIQVFCENMQDACGVGFCLMMAANVIYVAWC